LPAAASPYRSRWASATARSAVFLGLASPVHVHCNALVVDAFATYLDVRHSRLDALSQLLRSLSHKSVLDRGFVLVRDQNGHPLRHVAEAHAAGIVELEFADGSAVATLEHDPDAAISGGRGHRPGTASGPHQEERKAGDPQGQLF